MKPNVFIVCTGVGHINRGYESFSKECFIALAHDNNFEIFLLKGAGESTKHEIAISCIKRNTTLNAITSRLIRKDPYLIEQATFLVGMIPSIIRHKPVVIFYSDFILGTYLWHLKKFYKFKYKLLFSNGAPNGPPFKTEDHIQQLLPVYLNLALQGGTPRSMQTLLPYGFDIDKEDRLKNIDKKADLMIKLGLPTDKKIILSVGAINKKHKRMHYIINEVAKLPENYFLVILGQFESDTAELIELAASKLPDRYSIKNVPYEIVKDYYIASDYFVLASLIEGFGRVLIEALSYGLPCIVHDYVNAKQVLAEYGVYVDMQKEDELSLAIQEYQPRFDKRTLIEAAYNGYSWDRLKDKYSEMITNLFN